LIASSVVVNNYTHDLYILRKYSDVVCKVPKWIYYRDTLLFFAEYSTSDNIYLISQKFDEDQIKNYIEPNENLNYFDNIACYINTDENKVKVINPNPEIKKEVNRINSLLTFFINILIITMSVFLFVFLNHFEWFSNSTVDYKII
jgi:hypothetical protein